MSFGEQATAACSGPRLSRVIVLDVLTKALAVRYLLPQHMPHRDHRGRRALHARVQPGRGVQHVARRQLAVHLRRRSRSSRSSFCGGCTGRARRATRFACSRWASRGAARRATSSTASVSRERRGRFHRHRRRRRALLDVQRRRLGRDRRRASCSRWCCGARTVERWRRGGRGGSARRGVVRAELGDARAAVA